MLKKTLLSLAIATSAITLVACNDTETVVDPVETETTPDVVVDETAVEAEPMVETDPMVDTEVVATQNITEMAASNPDLSTLVAALQAAGLDQTLATDGQFTVFAPNNAAFEDLLATLGVTQEELLADKDLLTSVLTYHVVPDTTVMAADIPYGNDITTVNGAAFNISDANVITGANGGTANITAPDMVATNGVVHVIDTVLLPQ
ncbi:fasciclin domain-containing protein [Psychrobacter jeotgali]|uniref:fasciclin domain-containing protein n=1 Tax=Psychrobacter jeotgali TaxID=179010 RepID=UPI00191938FC|nr:fasciclin domain-containing protein [Psychrobacter jeotgali]